VASKKNIDKRNKNLRLNEAQIMKTHIAPDKCIEGTAFLAAPGTAAIAEGMFTISGTFNG